MSRKHQRLRKKESSRQDGSAPFGTGSRSAGRLTKGERTKRRIMAAPRKVLEERGYQGTRIEDIATAAGVAKGTLYVYFEDKKDLIMAVMREEMTDGQRELLSSRTSNDAFSSILEPNLSYIRMAFDNPGLFRALFEFAIIHPEALYIWSNSSAEWLARVEAAMERRLGSGRTEERARVIVTYAMSWMIDGILLSNLILDHPRLQRSVNSPEQLAEMLSVLWYRAVFGRDPNPERLEHAKPLLDFSLPADPSDVGDP